MSFDGDELDFGLFDDMWERFESCEDEDVFIAAIDAPEDDRVIRVVIEDVKQWHKELRESERNRAVLTARIIWSCFGKLLDQCVSEFTTQMTMKGKPYVVRHYLQPELEKGIFGIHVAACGVLKVGLTAEETDKIDIAGRLCRNIFYREIHPEDAGERKSVWWPRNVGLPDCLDLLSLPADVRTAIVEGCAIVDRIGKAKSVTEPSQVSQASHRLRAITDQSGGPPDETPVDGPHPPNAFCWNGRCEQITPLAYKLLAFMWERRQRPATEAAVVDALWGETHDKTTRNLKDPIRLANACLEQLGAEFMIGQKNGFVVME